MLREREANVDISVDMGQRPSDKSWMVSPERALEIKAKARALFVQGLEYTSLDDADARSLARAKPVWE